MIFALLGLNFLIVGATIFAAASRSSSFAVERDYDRKALHWEETARQQRRNRELGWKVAIDSTDGGVIAVSLTDAAGRPLEAATVDVEAFHHASAGTRLNVRLSSTAPGRYAGAGLVGAPGLWEFRLVVKRGPDVMTHSITQTVAVMAKAGVVP
ncbi:FixH family protein [Synechococcus sp. Cruz CV-v-12]|uniref:FixH family protein n=1 Tax=Synechococcus sp. Cruz CV-v-12 TaxID=2823728 RepID=UPI0020CC984A|nr:FixH family protein [Synechococcus sp. Cruz CV-v-12]